jgi:dolichol kinase
MMKETKRQLSHLLVCVTTLLILVFLSKNWLSGITFTILIIGSIIINIKLRNNELRLIDWFVREFEREEVRFPGWGSACIATGVLILATYLREPSAVAAGLVVLGLGDGLSTLIGKTGRHKLPWNQKKTWEGTIAFFFGSLPAALFIGWTVVPLAIVSAVVESVDFGIDDNLLIPIACVIVLLVL